MGDTSRVETVTSGALLLSFGFPLPPRKRRPRLIDEVVTLAHGAGGKSSAPLGDPLPRIC
jgi:hypothetical protein